MTIKKRFFLNIKGYINFKLILPYALIVILCSKKFMVLKIKKNLVFRKSGGIHDIKASINTGLIKKMSMK